MVVMLGKFPYVSDGRRRQDHPPQSQGNNVRIAAWRNGSEYVRGLALRMAS